MRDDLDLDFNSLVMIRKWSSPGIDMKLVRKLIEEKEQMKSKQLVLYTKDNCPACSKLKAEMDKDGASYKVINVGKDITREEFIEKFPHVRTMPHLDVI